VSKPDRSGRSRSSKKSGRQRRDGPRKPAPATTLAILDRLLLRKVRTSINGEKRDMTTLEAIIHQLVQKEAAGDSRASRVLLKFEELARQGTGAPLQIAFVDSDYVQALAAPVPEAGHG
jgi:hypothetical protein